MVTVGIDPKVRAMMDAFFGNERCSKCGRPAERFIGKEFVCHEHSLSRADQDRAAVVLREIHDSRPSEYKQARGRVRCYDVM